MKQKLSFASRIWIGFTLFSIIFGTGSLMIIPYLGFCAGNHLWLGMAGFWAGGIFLPLLGTGIAAAAGGLDKLTARIHPRCSLLLLVPFYLLLIPLGAVPKTARMSYPLVLLPLIGEKTGNTPYLIYLLFFFLTVYLLSLRPEKLVNRLGKVMTPCLLFLIALIFAGCICWPMGQWTLPSSSYADIPVIRGFFEGYQGMGLIIALSFTIVLTLTIREKGVTNDNFILREVMVSCLVAGFLLTLVCGILAYIGSLAGTGLPGAENGAAILSWAFGELYGENGLRILSVIYLITCLNGCAGLICCCSKYFFRHFPRLPYPGWAAIFSWVGFFLAKDDMEPILAFSRPLIQSIYPVMIVLLILSLIHPWISHMPLIYPCCTLATALAGLAENLGKIPGCKVNLFPLLKLLPGYIPGFGWLIPAAIGAFAGIVGSCFLSAARKNHT